MSMKKSTIEICYNNAKYKFKLKNVHLWVTGGTALWLDIKTWTLCFKKGPKVHYTNLSTEQSFCSVMELACIQQGEPVVGIFSSLHGLGMSHWSLEISMALEFTPRKSASATIPGFVIPENQFLNIYHHTTVPANSDWHTLRMWKFLSVICVGQSSVFHSNHKSHPIHGLCRSLNRGFFPAELAKPRWMGFYQ